MGDVEARVGVSAFQRVRLFPLRVIFHDQVRVMLTEKIEVQEFVSVVSKKPHRLCFPGDLLLTLHRTIRIDRSQLRNNPINAGIQKHRESRPRAMEGIANDHLRKPERYSSGIDSLLKSRPPYMIVMVDE